MSAQDLVTFSPVSLDSTHSDDIRAHFTELVRLVRFLGRSCVAKYPLRSGAAPCKFFMQTGSCSYGSACKFDHPINIFCGVEIETFSQNDASAVTNILRFANDIILIEESSSTLHFPTLCRAIFLAVRLVEDAMKYNIDRLSVANYPEASELIKHCFPRFRTILHLYMSPQNEKYNRALEAIIARINYLTDRWLHMEEIYFHMQSELESEITDGVSEWITRFVGTQNSQITSMNPIKGRICQTLREYFQTLWSDRTVATVAFGSSLSGFGSSTSDLDLCLMIPGVEISKEAVLSVNKSHLIGIKDVFESITSAKLPGFSVIEMVMSARIPVLKLQHNESAVQVDICVNNPLAISNTKLLRQYAEFDGRVRPVVLAVKAWAKIRGCNDPRNSTLSSYAWTLLVVHYLQKRCSPPVLPNLMVPGAKESFRGGNNSSVGQLLLGFFLYYGTGCADSFNIHSTVASIRPAALDRLRLLPEGQQLPPAGPLLKACADPATRDLHNQNEKKHHPVAMAAAVQWRMSIEDPFEDHDLGRTVWARDGQAFIIRELRRAAMIFQKYITSFQASRSAGVQSFEHEARDGRDGDEWAEIATLLLRTDMDSFDNPRLIGQPVLTTPFSTCSLEEEFRAEREQHVGEMFRELLQPNTNIPNLLATCRCCGLAGHSSSQCGQEKIVGARFGELQQQQQQQQLQHQQFLHQHQQLHRDTVAIQPQFKQQPDIQQQQQLKPLVAFKDSPIAVPKSANQGSARSVHFHPDCYSDTRVDLSNGGVDEQKEGRADYRSAGGATVLGTLQEPLSCYPATKHDSNACRDLAEESLCAVKGQMQVSPPDSMSLSLAPPRSAPAGLVPPGLVPPDSPTPIKAASEPPSKVLQSSRTLRPSCPQPLLAGSLSPMPPRCIQRTHPYRQGSILSPSELV